MNEGEEQALSRGTRRWLEALTWHETLTEVDASELTSAIIRYWQAWYTDPANEQLFDNLLRLVADGGMLWQRRNTESSPDDIDSPVQIAVWEKRRSLRKTRDRRWPGAIGRLWVIAAVGLTMMAAMATATFWLPWGWAGTSPEGGWTTYGTDTGGLRNVRLRDGSVITLGGSTELRVSLSRQARSVELIRGEAWFRVAHDVNWPFIVEAGDREIRAVGTAFLVTRESDRVVVTVTAGTVSVTALSPAVRLSPIVSRGAGLVRLVAPIRVTRGEEVSYRDNGTTSSVADADTHAATEWTHGRLVFDDEPLRYAIEDVNRYFPRRISATASAGRLRFSGVILDDEIDDWLHILSQTFPVDVVENGSNICIHMRAAELDSSCGAAR